MSLATLPPLRDVIRRLGLSARRSLGQNFILDLNLTAKIARAAGPLEGRTVLEVGPGPGGLTRALIAEGAARVVAIEKDARCLPALAEIAAACSGRLEVVAGDATEVDQRALAGEGALIVANLPYSVGTLLLVSWLTVEPWPPWYASMTLMFQREVADRLVADVGSREYGRLSVIAQWRTEPRILFGLPARAFTPVPRVDSALVRLVPRANPLPCSERALAKVTAAAFGQRRKMLRASLKQIWPAPEPVLEAEGIDARLRAEDIDVAAFCRLALRLDSAS